MSTPGEAGVHMQVGCRGLEMGRKADEDPGGGKLVCEPRGGRAKRDEVELKHHRVEGEELAEEPWGPRS